MELEVVEEVVVTILILVHRMEQTQSIDWQQHNIRVQVVQV